MKVKIIFEVDIKDCKDKSKNEFLTQEIFDNIINPISLYHIEQKLLFLSDKEDSLNAPKIIKHCEKWFCYTKKLKFDYEIIQ